MPLQILLADENLVVQSLVEMTLTQEDMEVTITDNGLSALDIAIKCPPDLILADYQMAGIDAASFLKKLKDREDTADVPMIVLIDSCEMHDSAYLKSLGIKTVLKKPIDTEELLEGVKALNLLPGSPVEAFDLETDESELSQHFTSSDDDSKMIADLLGWSAPEDVKDPEADESSVEAEKDIPDSSGLESKPDPQGMTEVPVIHENRPSDSEEPEEESVLSDNTVETFEEASPEDKFPFESGGPFSDEEPGDLSGESLSTPDEMGGSEEVDLAEAPGYGESVTIPHEESEAESEAVVFEEHATESPQYDSGEEVAEVGDAECEASASDDLIRKTIQERTEQIVRELLPGLVKSSLSREMISPIVEGVAWELIPTLAEAQIKKEIERLQPEKKVS